MTESEVTGQRGVHRFADRILGLFHWYVREQPNFDRGVDAHIEIVNDDGPTGRLIAAQVKTGSSYLRERTAEGFVFRPKPGHVRYWQGHSLPVIVVLVDLEVDACYWQVVNDATLTANDNRWRVIVPFSQVIDADSEAPLRQLTDARRDADLKQLDQLRAAKPWMARLRDGQRVLVEADEWINKTSGRGEIHVLIEDDAGAVVSKASWFVFFGLTPYSEALPALFPWANLDVDDSMYEDVEEDRWRKEEGIWDNEDGVYITFGDFGEWRAGLPRLRPYGNSAGEVDHWRLELELNGLGRGFLAVDDYLASGTDREILGLDQAPGADEDDAG